MKCALSALAFAVFLASAAITPAHADDRQGPPVPTPGPGGPPVDNPIDIKKTAKKAWEKTKDGAAVVAKGAKSVGRKIGRIFSKGGKGQPGGHPDVPPLRTEFGTVKMNYYTVNGRNLEEVLAKLPKGPDEYAGRTGWSFHHKLYSSGPNHIVNDVGVRLDLKITMPSWPGIEKQPQDVQDEWQRIWQTLYRHEQGHVDIYARMYHNFAQTLVGKTESEAKKAIKDMENKVHKAQQEYDKRTDHGRKQVP